MSAIFDNLNEEAWAALVAQCMEWDSDPDTAEMADIMVSHRQDQDTREMVRDLVMSVASPLDSLWIATMLAATEHLESHGVRDMLGDGTLMMVAQCLDLEISTYASLAREITMLHIWEQLGRPDDFKPEDLMDDRVDSHTRQAFLMAVAPIDAWHKLVVAATNVDELREKVEAMVAEAQESGGSLQLIDSHGNMAESVDEYIDKIIAEGLIPDGDEDES